MSNLKDIFGEVETILVENQEKRESIRDAAKELEAKVIASMQVSTPIHGHESRAVRGMCPLKPLEALIYFSDYQKNPSRGQLRRHNSRSERKYEIHSRIIQKCSKIGTTRRIL